jgi:hypothetical protein
VSRGLPECFPVKYLAPPQKLTLPRHPQLQNELLGRTPHMRAIMRHEQVLKRVMRALIAPAALRAAILSEVEKDAKKVKSSKRRDMAVAEGEPR